MRGSQRQALLDAAGAFIDASCIKDVTALMPAWKLYVAHCHWSLGQNQSPLTACRLSRCLRELGFHRDRTHWIGLRLRDQGSPDTVSLFVDTYCVRDNAARAATSLLYLRYCAWSAARAEAPVSQKIFGGRLCELGFSRCKSSRIFWLGLQVPEHFFGSLAH